MAQEMADLKLDEAIGALERIAAALEDILYAFKAQDTKAVGAPEAGIAVSKETAKRMAAVLDDGTRYAIGDVYGPYKGYIAGPYDKPSKCILEKPHPTDEDLANGTLFIWKISNMGEKAIARYDRSVKAWKTMEGSVLTVKGA